MNAGSLPDKSPILSGHPDWAALRVLFPTLRHKAYLASSSYGLLAKPVEAALRLYLDDWLEKGVRLRASRACHSLSLAIYFG
jgi:hypothetical protein